MEIYQLRTFFAVAREGSITRASERLFLSQPAVSAHIKAIEDTLDVKLFERTPRGMNLTNVGQRLLAKTEHTLGAHRELLEEAARFKGSLTGKLRLGAGSNASIDSVARLLSDISYRWPQVEVILQHGTSLDVLNGLRNGSLDAGFYNETNEPGPDLITIEVSHFAIYVAASPGVVAPSKQVDWHCLSELPWVYPTCSICCGNVAENLFKTHNFRPKRIISIDHENVTRSLLAGGIGVGLLHEDCAADAKLCGEVEIICEAQQSVRVLFTHLADREHDPLLNAVRAIVRPLSQ
jgi:DNA-binding transcriptional LysR family regulator